MTLVACSSKKVEDETKQDKPTPSTTQEESHQKQTASRTSSASQPRVEEEIPTCLVDSWIGASPQSSSLRLSLTESGIIKSSATARTGRTTEWSAIIHHLELVAPNLYLVTSYSGNYNAFWADTSELGGDGYKVAFGFKIENAQLIPATWITPETDDNFDYSQFHSLGYALSKE